MKRIGSRDPLALVALGGCLLSFLAAWPPAAEAGNKGLVEQRVRELDALNQQAVQQIPELPRDGEVDLKAKVRMSGDQAQIEIIEKSVSVKEETITFEGGQAPQAAEPNREAADENNAR